MADPVDKAKLEALEKRIAAAKGVEKPRPKIEDHHAQVQQGWRMVIELVAGIAIGFGMGYGLDALLGTLPIFLVVMTLLGFVAGVRTMLRTAKELQDEQEAAARPTDEGRDLGD